MDESQFQRVLNQVRNRDGGLLTADQVQDLKRLYDQALAGVDGETGRELSEAARRVLQEKQSAAGEKTAATDPQGEKKPEGAAPQPKGQLSPEAVDGFLKGLNASFGRAVPAQEADAGEGLLSERGALAALEKILGKDKDKGKDGDGREDRDRGRPPFPPGADKGERVRDEDRSKKGEDNTHKLLEALKGRDQNRGGGAPPPPSGGEKEAKQEQKEQKSGGEESAPKRPREEEEPPKKDDKKTDLASKPDANSLLDALTQNQKGPPPKKSPLPPMAPDAGGGLFGGSAASSALGAGSGAAAGAAMGGMLGGLGGAISSGSSAAMSGPDPFGSVGGGGMLGEGGGPAGGPGYTIAKEGGYVGGSGGADVGGEVSGGDLGGIDDDIAPYVPPVRIPTYAEQVIDMTPTHSAEPQGFLLQRYVGYVGRSLCKTADAQKLIGICLGLEAKRQRALWWERMRKGEVSKR